VISSETIESEDSSDSIEDDIEMGDSSVSESLLTNPYTLDQAKSGEYSFVVGYIHNCIISCGKPQNSTLFYGCHSQDIKEIMKSLCMYENGTTPELLNQVLSYEERVRFGYHGFGELEDCK